MNPSQLRFSSVNRKGRKEDIHDQGVSGKADTHSQSPLSGDIQKGESTLKKLQAGAVRLLGISLVIGASACSAAISGTTGTEQDSGVDAGRDDTNRPDTNRTDTGRVDSGPRDSGIETAVDSGEDAGVDGSVDAGTDAGVDSAPDALGDAGRCPFMRVGDGGVRDSGTTDGASDRPDGYTYPPTGPSATFQNLVGDYVDRTLGDRHDHRGPLSAETSYPTSNAETNANANPFTNGLGSLIPGAPPETIIYRIGGSDYPTFATRSVLDSSAGTSYSETQQFWVRGNNRFDQVAGQVVGGVDFVAYQAKFDGLGSNQSGIPVCTHTFNYDYSACLRTGGNLAYATATHRVPITLWGQQWIILNMTPPTTTTENPNEVVRGGSIRIGQESVSGILNSIDGGRPDLVNGFHVDGLYFVLESLETHEGRVQGIMGIYDEDCNIVRRFRATEGNTISFSIHGRQYNFHTFKLAPGYTAGARWIEAALLSELMTLEDGQRVDQDNARPGTEGTRVLLTWKNRDAGTGRSNVVDSLRSVVVYSDTPGSISSNGSDTLRTGDYMRLIGNSLQYRGLDLTPADRMRVSFELRTGSSLAIGETDGPMGRDGRRVRCTVDAPYLQVIASDSGSVFYMDTHSFTSPMGGGPTISDSRFYVALNGATCDRGHTMPPLSILMRESSSSTQFSGQFFPNTVLGSGVRLEPTVGWGQNIGFSLRADVERETGIPLQRILDTSGHGRVCASGDCADVYVSISERALDSRIMYDHMHFGVHNTHTGSPGDATFQADSATTDGFGITSSGRRLLYMHAVGLGEYYAGPSGPVTPGIQNVDEGYITERGSLFVSKAATTVRIDIARRLGRAVWSFGM